MTHHQNLELRSGRRQNPSHLTPSLLTLSHLICCLCPLSQDPNFNLLYQYVIHAKLDGYLSGAAGPLTFFAPNNTGKAGQG